MKNITAFHSVLICFLLLNILPETGSLAKIPSSKRSKDVIARQTPILLKEINAKGLTLGQAVCIRIFKEEKELELWIKKGSKFSMFKSYPICTFSGELGSKKKVGDGQAPEGFYTVYPEQLNPSSDFHLAFNIGYPNAYDRAHHYTGSAIMVHGNCVSIGCYAMTDPRIEEIFTVITKAFEGGQSSFQVQIYPFRMTREKMEAHTGSEWTSFWQNIKTGYDYFETHQLPPAVTVSKAKYVFK